MVMNAAMPKNRHGLTTISQDYTPLDTDKTIVVTSGAVTVTLPNAQGRLQKIYDVHNKGAGIVTMATTDSQTISEYNSADLILIQHESVTVQSDDNNWIIL